jgi:hypothetical protein
MRRGDFPLFANILLNLKSMLIRDASFLAERQSVQILFSAFVSARGCLANAREWNQRDAPEHMASCQWRILDGRPFGARPLQVKRIPQESHIVLYCRCARATLCRKHSATFTHDAFQPSGPDTEAATPVAIGMPSVMPFEGTGPDIPVQ